MARKLRLEFEGAVYHVINRGNYRADIFRDEGAKLAFLTCLGEACEKSGWVVHAWCVMSNHYHLALETPRANLVEGMQWLQSTFSMRFNRYRGENGHLFQGRYKSLVVDPSEALGPLCHYIHLNPVRAGIAPVVPLAQWPWSSFRWIAQRKERAAWFSPHAALDHAGGLADTAAGYQKYGEYLAWLAEDAPEQKRLNFERMSKGWMIGARNFKVDLVKSDLAEAKTKLLEERLCNLLAKASKSDADCSTDRKSASWKIEIAVAMKTQTTASNDWLAKKLRMGSPFTVSRLANAWIAAGKGKSS